MFSISIERGFEGRGLSVEQTLKLETVIRESGRPELIEKLLDRGYKPENIIQAWDTMSKLVAAGVLTADQVFK